jgi:hypothetical protein
VFPPIIVSLELDVRLSILKKACDFAKNIREHRCRQVIPEEKANALNFNEFAHNLFFTKPSQKGSFMGQILACFGCPEKGRF